MGSLLYGILCTLFTAVRSETFVSDFKVVFKCDMEVSMAMCRRSASRGEMGGTDRRSDPTTDSRLYYSLVDPDCNCSGCCCDSKCHLMMGYVNLYEDYKKTLLIRSALQSF